jgi:DNA-binding SARP family transcriptional activator
MAIASAYASLGESRKAKRILRNLVLYSKKKEMRASDALEVLLSDEEGMRAYECVKSADLAPSRFIALQLKKKRYARAYDFAERKGILAYLHRFIFFAPESVRDMLEKGKRTHLPRAVLQLPIFNRDIPTYNIRFLGKLVVYKNQQYLRVDLRPKDTAFLVHLALRAGEPDKRIYLEDIFRNFWRKSENPTRNLSHLLVRIRRMLKLPTHLLEISYSEDAPCLVNRGIHFITDYDEFQQIITQAKALARAGQWRFAKREYGNALRLFRGEPFTRMYDDWSDDRRLEVIFGFENAAISFLKELIARGQKNAASRLFQKLRKIIPYSEEMEKVLEDS